MTLQLLPRVGVTPGEAVTDLLPVRIRRRIHWGDGDAAMIAYTSRFVDYAMEAVDAWWEVILDRNWYELRMSGGGSPTVSLGFDFTHPVRPGERIELSVEIEKLGTASLTAKVTGVSENQQPCFTGRITTALIDFERHKAKPFPESWRRRIQRYQQDCNSGIEKLAAPEAVLNYWFGAPDSPERLLHRPLWFGTGVADKSVIDAEIRAQFSQNIAAAEAGKLDHWLEEPRATLALILLADQFTRNVHRGSAQAFASDALARRAAAAAIARGDEQDLPLRQAMFYYLPYEHSEDLADQDRCIALFERFEASAEDPEAVVRILDYAEQHRRIIARFGRFPHRNETLGRSSTAEETTFLKEPNASF